MRNINFQTLIRKNAIFPAQSDRKESIHESAVFPEFKIRAMETGKELNERGNFRI